MSEAGSGDTSSRAAHGSAARRLTSPPLPTPHAALPPPPPLTDIKHADACLSRLGIADLFTGRIICYESIMAAAAARGLTHHGRPVVCKPANVAMQLALAACGAPDGARVAFFDDSTRNVAAGARAGIFSVLVGGGVVFFVGWRGGSSLCGGGDCGWRWMVIGEARSPRTSPAVHAPRRLTPPAPPAALHPPPSTPHHSLTPL